MLKSFSDRFSNYLSLVKFSHTIFAMPFACIGFFLAVQTHGETFSLKVFVLVLLCMVFARSAAMAFNRYIDRDIDKENNRTAIREIPSGIIRPQSALLFVIFNAAAFVLTTFFINRLCFLLSPIALFIILGYSYTKRFTAWCHLVLGIGLSLAPLGAYLAVTGKFALLPVLFSFAVLFWVSGFDIIYALQDEEFDRSRHLRSIPVALGKENSLKLSVLLHFITALLIIYAGLYASFTSWYWMGTLFFIALLVRQHTLVKPHDLRRVNLAFFTSNGIASILFALFVLLELFL